MRERERLTSVGDHEGITCRLAAAHAEPCTPSHVGHHRHFWFKECSPAPETSGPTPPTGATRLDPPSYPLGATTHRRLTHWVLSVLTYSLSPALSHPTYREHGIKRCILDPSTMV